MIPSCVTCLIVATVASESDEIAQSVAKHENASRPNTLIMLQPISLLSNWAIVTVESAFSDKMSRVISLGAAYRSTMQDAQSPDAGSWKATNRNVNISLETGFNHFFDGTAP